MAEPVVPEKEEIIEEEIEKKEEAEAPEDPDKVEEEAEEEAEEEEEEPAPPSRRENLRIQKLIQQRDEAAARTAPEVPGGLDYAKDLAADADVVKQLEADRKAYGEKLFQQGVAQADAIKFQTRLEIDAPRVEAKHPELDKESSDFHPGLANAINEMYLSSVGYNEKTGSVVNPNIRYGDYVESVWELAMEIAGQQTTTAKKNIAKQAAGTGLRPDGSATKRLNLNKAPGQMTNEELEAAIKLGFK